LAKENKHSSKLGVPVPPQNLKTNRLALTAVGDSDPQNRRLFSFSTLSVQIDETAFPLSQALQTTGLTQLCTLEEVEAPLPHKDEKRKVTLGQAVSGLIENNHKTSGEKISR
jgi:hypothetical protein